MGYFALCWDAADVNEDIVAYNSSALFGVLLEGKSDSTAVCGDEDGWMILMTERSTETDPPLRTRKSPNGEMTRVERAHGATEQAMGIRITSISIPSPVCVWSNLGGICLPISVVACHSLERERAGAWPVFFIPSLSSRPSQKEQMWEVPKGPDMVDAQWDSQERVCIQVAIPSSPHSGWSIELPSRLGSLVRIPS